jgi:hypothetical protein
MSKIKFLYIAIVGLIVLNLAILSFVFFKAQKGRDEMGRQNNPREIVIKKLHFNSNQIAKYDSLILKHREKINSLDNEIKEHKNKLYRSLSTEIKKSTADSLIAGISKNQVIIERLHYQHFVDIKNLCNTNQVEYFNHFTTELSQIFSPKERPTDRNRERP